MTNEQVRTAIAASILSLKSENPPLDFNVHEQATTHPLAVHFETHFNANTWNVDCEYNHDGQQAKELIGIKGCKKEKKTNLIVPDIIVHHRKKRGRDHNLLVVEVKVDQPKNDCDWAKLKLLTRLGGNYQYRLGLYINICLGAFHCVWFEDGHSLSA